jgi:Chromo (CHRromatin Organisation MOdifier) domain
MFSELETRCCCLLSILLRQRIKVERGNWPVIAGPYEVVQVVSPVAVKLSLPSGTKANLVFHTSMLRPYVPDTTGERTPPPPEPVIVDGFEEYEVEQILAQRRSRNQALYLVKWKNYPVSDASWEPHSNLEGNESLIAFQEASEGT